MGIKYVALNGINGSTVVHLDSATTLEEAKRDLNLLEDHEPWILQLRHKKEEGEEK